MDHQQKLLLKQFLAETNLEEGLAQDVLAGSNWNYDQAIASFKRMLQTNDRRLSFTSPQATSSTSAQSVKTKSPTKGQRSPKSPDGSPPVGSSPLHRGISRANLKVKNGGKKVELPVSIPEDDHQAKVDSRGYYFMLPNLHVLPQDLSNIIKKDLLDLQTMKHLHKAGCLNWWSSAGTCGPLYAMETSGDGNCLLHAASLSIWGMHDRELTLRTMLNKLLTDENFTVKLKKIQRRWKRQQIQVNRELGLEYTAQEWEEEWESVLKLSSTKPRQLITAKKDSRESIEDNETTYESLEEIHVFVLAHILHRPIIIVGDKYLRDFNGEPLAPNTFGGIYLPLEAKASECCRSPVVLAYDASHFCPLLPMDSDKIGIPNVIPITDSERELLRVQFAADPGITWKFDQEKDIALELSVQENLNLLQKYLDLVKVPITPQGSAKKSTGITAADLASSDNIVCVPLSNERHPEYHDLIKNYINEARKKLARKYSSTSSVAQSTTNRPPAYNNAAHTTPGSKAPQKELYLKTSSPGSPPKGGSRQPATSTDASPPYRYSTLPSQEKTTGPRFEQNPAGVQGSSNHGKSTLPSYNSATLPERGGRSRGHQETARIGYSTAGSKQLPISTEGPPPYNYAVSKDTTDGSRSSKSPPASAPRKLPPSYDSGKHSPNSQTRHPRPPTRKCRNAQCSFFGTENTDFYCTKCFQVIIGSKR